MKLLFMMFSSFSATFVALVVADCETGVDAECLESIALGM